MQKRPSTPVHEEVHAALLLEYNSVFDNTSVSAMGDALVPHTRRAQFPMVVVFADVAGDSDQSTLSDLALAVYGKPATAADYQAIMENHTTLPGLIESHKHSVPSAAPGTEGVKKGGGKLEGGKPTSSSAASMAAEASPSGDKNGPGSQFMPPWRCGHMVSGDKKLADKKHSWSKKLEEMFDLMHQGIAGRTFAAMAQIGKSVAPSIAHCKLVRVESLQTRECSEVGLAWAADICEESGQEFAGYTSVPRSYYDIKGCPDEDVWYGAADKELTKLFDMGTFEITEDLSVPKGTKIMDTV